MKPKKKSDDTKSTEKFCKLCDKFINLTTWVSKSGSKHDEWLTQQKAKKGKKKKELTVGDKEKAEEKIKEDDVNDDAVGDDRMRFDDGGTGALDLLCAIIENNTDANNGTILI